MKTNIYLIDFDGVIIDNQWELKFQQMLNSWSFIQDEQEKINQVVYYWESQILNNELNLKIKIDLNPVIIQFIQDIKKYEHGAQVWLFTNRSERIKEETLALLPKSVQKLFNKMMFLDGRKGIQLRNLKTIPRRPYDNYNYVVIDDKPEYVELGDPGSFLMSYEEFKPKGNTND